MGLTMDKAGRVQTPTTWTHVLRINTCIYQNTDVGYSFLFPGGCCRRRLEVLGFLEWSGKELMSIRMNKEEVGGHRLFAGQQQPCYLMPCGTNS